MKTKKEVPAGSEPAEDSNIINVGCVVERSKGNENIPFCKNNCKNNCNCLTTREKVLATLRNVHTIQEVASELGISYRVAFDNVNKLCEAGEVTVAGYYARRLDGRVSWHYQDADIFFRKHPQDLARVIFNSINKANYHKTGFFIGLGSNGELRVRWDRAKIKKINSRIWKQ